MSVLETLKKLVSAEEKQYPIEDRNEHELDDEDDDYDIDDEEYLAFVGDDVWEDNPAIKNVKARLPGWFVVKVTNFTEHTLRDVRNWCSDNCTDDYEEVGFYSSCSYTVGVAFEGHTDAVMFKLIWGTK